MISPAQYLYINAQFWRIQVFEKHTNNYNSFSTDKSIHLALGQFLHCNFCLKNIGATFI